ncbi:hypothetical protein AAWM_11010 [Aspergillus awamori]|uniref:Uncharacterized protein n=1 Tax=Aspergillus awamori TaxID=105351 RepID=A0A401L9H5_ASPAW|nr:hypothetical protein AAWM_11010 [Aspergillus awamori]
MSTLLTPLALVGWMGRAWDTDYTAPDTLPNLTGLEHPNATGLGWADGMGQGIDTQLYTVDQTPTRDWPRLGGWDGPGTTTRHTQHKHLYSTGLGWVGWDGPGITTRHTQHRLITGLASWFHCSNKPSLGWVVGSGLGYRIQHPPNSSLQWWTRHRLGGWDGSGTSDTGGWGLWSYKVTSRLKRLTASIFALSKPWLGGFTAVVSQASVGWLGRAWDIGHGGGVLKPWFTAVVNQALVGGRDGPGTSDTEGGGGLRIMEVTLLDSQSRDMTALSTYSRVLLYNTPSPGWVDGMGLGFTTAVDQASAGWLGRAWDTLTNLNSIVHHCSEPGLGWRLGRAWDMDSTPAVQAHHRSELGPGRVAGTGLGHRTRGVGVCKSNMIE